MLIVPAMLQLTPDEARVLGVLIEKAMTTPDQYPLSQNAVVNGANQKNNRDPVMSMDDNLAFEALEGLRGKGLGLMPMNTDKRRRISNKGQQRGMDRGGEIPQGPYFGSESNQRRSFPHFCLQWDRSLCIRRQVGLKSHSGCSRNRNAEN
jgi:hypothetical protein